MFATRQKWLDFILAPDNDGQDRVYKTPGDPGGWTRLGVTFNTFVGYYHVQREKTPDFHAFAAAPRSVFEDIYCALFWNGVAGDQLPAGVDLAVGNFACGSGTKPAAKLLQETLAMEPADIDGVIGPETLAACETAEAVVVIRDYTQRALAFYRSLPTFGEFGRGWTRRVSQCEALSLSLVGQTGT